MTASRKWTSIFFILILLFVFVGDGRAGDLTLVDAIRRGLENNFQVRISRRNLEIAQNNDSWGAAGRYPVIDLGINQNNSTTDAPGRSGEADRERYTTAALAPYVSLRWTLFNGFAIGIAKQRLALLNDISEGNAAVVVENTLQAIVLAYHNVLLQREKLKVAEEVRKLSKDRYDYVLSRKEIGIATTYDVLQARIAFLDDTSAVLLQELNLNNARRSLNLLLGDSADEKHRLTDIFEAKPRDYEWDALVNKMWSHNKTLKNQYINQAILKKDISLQQSALFPSLSVNSGIRLNSLRTQYRGLPAATATSYDYYVNFSLGINLFNGGNTRRAIANARIQEKIGKLQVEEIKLVMANQLRRQLELYNARKQLYRVAEERIESARLNMQISDEKFKAGAINSFNYRDVQLIYLDSAFGKYQAIYDLIDSHTELSRLTGSIISEY